MSAAEPLVHVVREGAGKPAGALILLHGRGADEHDLPPVLDVLDPGRRLVGLTPGAPLPGPGGGRWCFIPTVDGWEPDLDSRAGLPVFITHGSRDPVISVDFARHAQTRLEAGGLGIDYHEHGGSHHIDPPTMPLMAAWAGARIESF